MRCVLGLFEGVVTGAADGYYRIAGKPASTLLHLGPGLGNGLANLHNAKKAHSGIVNIVGDHATYHIQYDAPLTSDVEGVARPMSHWVRRVTTSMSVSADAAAAIGVAREPPGKIATLILPADTAWGAAEQVVSAPAPAPPRRYRPIRSPSPRRRFLERAHVPVCCLAMQAFVDARLSWQDALLLRLAA
jgi:acetolactate synthase-1/2/3 large subunit